MAGFSIIDSMALVMASWLVGSTKIAESRATSGIEVQLEVITGHSEANASRMGRPNPSYKLTNTSP